MKLGIMQPYFFPYIGYFSLICNTDEFILFDPVQFIKHGWIERNRILKQSEGWSYISVPLEKHSRETLIKDIKIRQEPWREKLLAQLTVYKKRAPFYNKTLEVVKRAVNIETESITLLNRNILQTVCDYLQIPFKCKVFSEMSLTIDTPQAPDEWALNICKAMNGVTQYWNPPGGMEFFDRLKYERAGIKLFFQKPVLRPYSQKREGPFEEGLSIIDVMMFNSPQDIRSMLAEYVLL